MTPRVVKRYSKVQEVEREAAGAVAEALSGIKMIAACGAETQMMDKYNKLVDRITVMSRALSPVLAVQHAPGMFDADTRGPRKSLTSCSILRHICVSISK